MEIPGKQLAYLAPTLAAAMLWSLGTEYAIADICKAPSPQKQSEVSSYVLKRYHFDPAAQITLVDSSQANASCYWKLHYSVSSPKSEVTLYLSPDNLYLVPSLFDLGIDPLAEERIKTEKLVKDLTAGDPPSIGPSNAPVTIVEFSDFECPFCKRFTDVLEKDLTTDERKNVRIVFREFPLSIHPWAKGAAELAGCAALQGDAAFWKVHDYLFANQTALAANTIRDNVTTFAIANAGVDQVQFKACLDRKLSTGGVEQDVDLGRANGVKVTPTLFVNGTRYEGAKDAAALRAILAGVQKQQSQMTAKAK